MKKCKICKTPFESFNSLIGHCSPKCGYELHKKNQDKKHKKVKAQFRNADKGINKLKAEAQKPINTYARLRDYWEPCISCGDTKEQVEAAQGWKTGGCWDAGHFKSRGAFPQLRFNLKNIHKQCKKCNGGSGKSSHKEKTTSEQYKINLIKKIGLSEVEKLENTNETRKFEREYLERLKKIFNKRARIKKKRLGL